MDVVFTGAQLVLERRHAINIFCILAVVVWSLHTHTRRLLFPVLLCIGHTPQQAGETVSVSAATFQSKTLRGKLKFDVNQAARELDVTGAFYST